MKYRNLLIIGSLAALGLVIVLGVNFFRMNALPPAASLHDVLWTLTSLQVNGQTHELVPNMPVTLTFHETSRTITGSSGCNSYQATYQQNNSQVRFQDFCEHRGRLSRPAGRARKPLPASPLACRNTARIGKYNDHHRCRWKRHPAVLLFATLASLWGTVLFWPDAGALSKHLQSIALSYG